jgi:putative membrane protein
MVSEFHPGYILNALVYAVLGILIFVIAFTLLDKLTPYDLWGEICEKRNVALAIMVGAMSIGISIIIASAVH